jgi:dihydrodipicolinate synthase/N-acetylneuraminate lyase
LPERLVAIVETFRVDPDAAERAWEQLLPLMRLEAFPPTSLAARKEVWRLRGVIGSSFCRRSGAKLDQRARDDVRHALERVEASFSPRSRPAR